MSVVPVMNMCIESDAALLKTRPRAASDVSTTTAGDGRSRVGSTSFDTDCFQNDHVAVAQEAVAVPAGMVLCQVLIRNTDGSQTWMPVLMPAVEPAGAGSAEALRLHASALRREAAAAKAAAKAARRVADVAQRRFAAEELRRRAARAAARKARRAEEAPGVSDSSTDDDCSDCLDSGLDADLSDNEDDGVESDFGN